MSTHIKEIKGRKEGRLPLMQPKYTDSYLSLTRFYGGTKNGMMLQLTINNDEGHSYVQLTKKQVEELGKVLLQAFDDKVYPNE